MIEMDPVHLPLHHLLTHHLVMALLFLLHHSVILLPLPLTLHPCLRVLALLQLWRWLVYLIDRQEVDPLPPPTVVIIFMIASMHAWQLGQQ